MMILPFSSFCICFQNFPLKKTCASCKAVIIWLWENGECRRQETRACSLDLPFAHYVFPEGPFNSLPFLHLITASSEAERTLVHEHVQFYVLYYLASFVGMYYYLYICNFASWHEKNPKLQLLPWVNIHKRASVETKELQSSRGFYIYLCLSSAHTTQSPGSVAGPS